MIYELIYIGKGNGILQGVPARNLTDADLKYLHLSVEDLIASGLYQRPQVGITTDDAQKLIKHLRTKRSVKHG